MRVVLGVSGGIAAYKSAEIVRAFVKRGDEVRVVMTRGAQAFITPLTLQVLSGHPVGIDLFDPTYESEIGHIDLARWADVILLAPATAQLVARIAHGMADDLLSTVLLASTAPVVVAPAMNTQMYRHASVQQNLHTISNLPGYTVVEPDAGELACKEVGPGRLPDANVLLEMVDTALTPRHLQSARILISAGPTREHLDPARFISNPSSGKMGYALASAARRMGAQVTLVSGPTSLETPYGIHRLQVESAMDMRNAVISVASEYDVVIMVAAVADWRPRHRKTQKVAKSDMVSTLELERNPDILAELGARFGPHASSESGSEPEEATQTHPLLVGFAAETDHLVERGWAKMARKGCHLLVANKIGGPESAFGADHSTVYLLDSKHHDQDEMPESIGPLPKKLLAERVLEVVARRLEEWRVNRSSHREVK